MRSDPLILAFATSAAQGAAALLSGDRVIAARVEEMKKGQAERLFPLLEDILAEGGTAWSDLTRIGVGIGPGNFTGIRIAVSAARGLALSLDVPAIGVSTFQALTWDLPGDSVALVPAPQNRAYVQHMTAQGSEDPQLIQLEDIADLSLPAGLTWVGAGAEDIAPRLNGTATAPRAPLAEAIARIAARTDASTAPSPAPLYLRPADAAPPRDAPPEIVA